jgi:hypothetical protein
MSDAQLLEFVARLTYNIDGLSGRLRLYFSQFLRFHFSKTLSANRIESIEIRKASQALTTDDEIRNAATSLDETQRCWTVAAIQHLRDEARRSDDRVASRRLELLEDRLVLVLGLQDNTNSIQAERAKIEEEYRRFEERPVVVISSQIWPLTVDFFIRCSLLVYFSLNELNKSFLLGLNIALVTGLILVMVAIFRRGHRRANLKLLEDYGGVERFRVEYQVTASQYSWLALYLVMSTFISYLLPDQLHAIAFFGLAFYYFLYLRFFSLGRIRESDLVRQLDESEQHTETLDVDENDELIVSLETKLNSSTSRLDAYVLESALFGALSFSGFLQIMASDLLTFTDLEAFATNIFTTSQALIHLQWDAFSSGLALLNNKVSLFCLVSVESLVCSIFFLAVIASRLRFSDIADRVRTAISLARAFNEKEEALYHESERNDVRQSRLHELTQKVNRQLFEASQALRSVGPVVAYMVYFRNAGILVFLIILISSSLFITGVLGWIFLGLVAATSVYFNRDRINIAFKATFLGLRVVFFRRSYWFAFAALSPFVTGMILRNSFDWQATNEFTALGNLLVGLYLFTWLSLSSHYDEDFGEIEKTGTGNQTSRWAVVKNTVAAVTLGALVGLAFKNIHFAGADEIAMISLTMGALLMYFMGFYLSRVKWFGLISGMLLGSGSVGILFKILHLDGADEMLLMGMIGLAICSVIVWLNKKRFHSLLLRFCLALLFVTMTMWTGIFLRLDLAYAHRTWHVSDLVDVMTKSGYLYYGSDEQVRTGLAAMDEYIRQHGSSVPFTAVYERSTEIYDGFGDEALTNWALRSPSTDSTTIRNAALAVLKRDEVLALYNFSEDITWKFDLALEADLLLALGERDEAIAYLRKIRGMVPSELQRKALDGKIASLESTVEGMPGQ